MKGSKEMIRLVAGFIVASFIITAMGCGGDEPPPPPPSRTAQARAAQAKEKADAEVARKKAKITKETWSYDPTGKRDPFEVPFAEGPEDTNMATKYDLDQMWVDGIVWGAGSDVAHIVLPGKEAIFIKVGDELGINHGRVKQIRESQVVVEEIYVDPANPSEIHIIEKILEMRETKEKKRRR